VRKLRPFEYETLGRLLTSFVKSTEISLGNEKCNYIMWVVENQHNGFIGESIEDIVKQSGMGKSTVHTTMLFLKKEEFIFKNKEGYFLKNDFLESE